MPKGEPGGRSRMPMAPPNTGAPMPVKAVERMLNQARKDSKGARESESWQALSALLRLERQLEIDLEAARKYEAAAAKAEEEVALANRSDDALISSVIAAMRSLPIDMQERVMREAQAPSALRLVKAAR